LIVNVDEGQSYVVDPALPVVPTSWFAQLDGSAAAACDAVNVWPPIVAVVDRDAPAFALAENDTVPLPVPDDPDVIASQLGSVLAAVHEQKLGAVTPTVNVLAPAVSD